MPRNVESAHLTASDRQHQANPEHFPELQSNRFYLTRTRSEDQTQREMREEAENELSEAWSSSSRSSSYPRHTTGTQFARQSNTTENPRPGSNATISLTNTQQQERAVLEYLERHPTTVKRIQESQLQHAQTVGSSNRRDSGFRNLPAFGGGKEYPRLLPDPEEYVVDFDGPDDPRHPQNWPGRKKAIIFTILVFDSLSATLASSIFSPTAPAIQDLYNVGQEVTTLGTSLFVLGYALGPIAWAPLSELYGRRLPIISASAFFGIFMIAVAVSKDIQTLLICRFFAGIFGSCALTIVPAVFADIFDDANRGLAIAGFAAAIFNGPLSGPMIGGFIVKSYLGWRWTQYIPAFMGFACALAALFFQEESYSPVILVAKATELRRLTRNWGIHARQDEVEVDLKQLLTKNISRPMKLLFQDPMLFLVTFYMSFIYGILYLSLTAYSITFGQIYGFSPGVSGLPYIGTIIGIVAGFLAVVASNPRYVRALRANNNVTVPEWRLVLPMAGAVSFTGGLFFFGWTAYTGAVHWMAPTAAGVLLGFGIYTVFLQLLNYIIDSYLTFAASAIAANTFLRSLFGAVFPLFATQMYNGIGIQWGMTLLGCVSALLLPSPFIFYVYGKRIRARSKFASTRDFELGEIDEKEEEVVDADGDRRSGAV